MNQAEIEFRCIRRVFMDALTCVSKASVVKKREPILGSVLMEAAAGQVKLTCCNLDTSMSITIPAEVTQSGAASVNVKDLLIKLTQIREYKISMCCEMDRVPPLYRIKWSGGSPGDFLRAERGATFPKFRHIDPGGLFSIEEDKLAAMLSQTMYAMDQKGANPVHNGICFELKPNRLKMTAKNGYALSLRSADVACAGSFSFALSRMAVQAMAENLSQGNHNVSFYVGETAAQIIIGGNLEIKTNLLRGKFLDQEIFAAQPGAWSALLNKEQFLIDCEAAMKKSAAMGNSLPRVGLEFRPGEGVLISAPLSQSKVLRKLVPCDINFLEEPIEVHFFLKVLVNTLQAFDCEKVRWEMTDSPYSTARILPGDAAESDLALIIPIPAVPKD